MRAVPFPLLAGALIVSALSGVRASSGGARPPFKALQNPDAQSSAADASGLPAGTTICADLAKPIDTKKSGTKQAVVARVTLPVLFHGKVLIPDGAKILGHVTEATHRSEVNPESRLGIIFDRVVLKNGQEIRLGLTLQAIGLGSFAQAAMMNRDEEDPNAPRPTARNSSPAPAQNRRGGLPRPPEPSELPQPTTEDAGQGRGERPVLDAGSHGAIGFPDFAFTESASAEKGSVVISSKKDVKLDIGTQIVLRVVAETP
ncbi:MAG TPA: TrbI/VirB10 family protein [Candidatus Acidoferrum sp.]|nr:TrbI/VirB10 family protein [Candidatus Acidoferrum sp.]